MDGKKLKKIGTVWNRGQTPEVIERLKKAGFIVVDDGSSSDILIEVD